MLVVDTGELTKEFVYWWIESEFPFEPCIWVITDYGIFCLDITKRYTLEFLNLKNECAWAYSARSLDVVVTEARNMGLEGVRGVV